MTPTRRSPAAGTAAVLVATTLGALLAAGPAPAVAASDPDAVPIPVKPFVPRAGDDDQLVRAWEQWQCAGRRGVRHPRAPGLLLPAPAAPCGREVHADRTQLVTTVEDPPRVRRVKGYGADRIFRLLRRAYAEADAVQVAWTDTGLPRRISVDFIAGAADDEVTYRIRFAAS